MWRAFTSGMSALHAEAHLLHRGLSLCRISRCYGSQMTSGRQVDTQYLRKMPTRQQEVRRMPGWNCGIISIPCSTCLFSEVFGGTRRCNDSPSRRCVRMRKTEHHRRISRLRSMLWKSSTGSISPRRHRRDRKRFRRCRQAAGARILRQYSASSARGRDAERPTTL